MNRYIKCLPVAIMAVFVFCVSGSVQAQTMPATPGGINNTNITWLGWLTPDQYNSITGTWTNRITTAGTVGNFTQPANWTSKTPPAIGVGQNFYPAVQFRAASVSVALTRVMSENMIGITANDAFSFIIVYKRTKRVAADDNILNFGRNGDYEGDYNLYYSLNSGDVLYAGWTTSARTLGAVPFNTTQLLTVDNANAATGNGGGIRQYLGGAQLGNTAQSANGSANTAGTGSSEGNYKIMLGSSHWDWNSNGERGLYGDIQEVIVLKRNRTAYPFMAATMSADFQKLHTYLAVKYGITLTNFDYLTASNLNVWTMANNTGFNNNIFGIGRDDASGINQKQSVSSTDGFMTLFVGNNLAALNSQNTSVINNGDFLMLGNNGLSTVTTLAAPVPVGTPFSNATLAYDLNFVNDKRWKAQVTSASGSMTVNMQLPASLDNKYLMVSSTNNFTAANAANIRLYPISASGRVTGVLINNGDYIAFGGLATGPAQVTAGLKLWLRAAEGVTSSQLPAGSSTGSADPGLLGYTSNYDGTAIPDGTTFPAVSAWTDVIRNITYHYDGVTTQRYPVYSDNIAEMNYKPAARFWQASGASAASYLSNSVGILPTANQDHTTVLVTNNAAPISSTGRTYMFSFGGTAISTSTSTLNPAYGTNQPSGSGNYIYPAMNEGTGSSTPATAIQFNQGATSIMSFRANASTKYTNMGLNGLNSSVLINSSGGMTLNAGSILGGGYNRDRTMNGYMSEVIMYDHMLTDVETDKLMSYLGLKYGVTLRKGSSNLNGSTLQNWDYILSDGITTAWAGVSDPNRYGNFHNHVAAIIRDDEGGLMNVQSHSTDKGSVVRMGIGTQLGNGDAAILGSVNTDQEFIIWGDNGAVGDYTKPANVCGTFNSIMNRKWMVRNRTAQPYDVIISPENNPLSVEPATDKSAFPYDGSSTVYLLIANTEDDINNNNFTQVIPGIFKDGQFQFSYSFANGFTYFTFGIAPNNAACLDDGSFTGTETLSFKNWPRGALTNTYTLDGVTATATVAFSPTNIRRNNYPRSRTAGTLDVYRATAGGVDGVATITIELSSPVNAKFKIGGIDNGSRSRDQITVTGYCGGTSPIYPDLDYNTTPKTAKYVISSNTALANLRNAGPSISDPRGTMLVNFNNGVKKIVITFNTLNRHRLDGIRIYPITITPSGAQQPPKFNDAGFAFQKKTDNSSVVSCVGKNTYQFTIYNANCDTRNVSFSDVLPAGLTWLDESLTLAATGITVNAYAGSDTLSIDSLAVPGTGSISFRAGVAAQAAGTYSNQATMTFPALVASAFVPKTMQSIDGITGNSTTDFSVIDVVSPVNVSGSISSQVTANRQYYTENDTITLTYTVTNGGAALSDIDLDVDYLPAYTNDDNNPADAFTYISYSNSNGSGTLVSEQGTLSLTGLTLPANSTTTIVFKFKAPAAPVAELDSSDQPIKLPNGSLLKSDFIADFTLYPDPDASALDTSDPCVETAFDNLSGTVTIRHAAGKDNVLVNEHITKQRGK